MIAAKKFWTVAVMAVLLQATVVAQAQQLSGDEIKKLITGNTVKGPIGARPYSFYYKPTGEVGGVIGAGGAGSGTWKIKQGNAYCHTWTDLFDGVEHCYEWHKDGKRYVMKNVDVDRSRDIPVWNIEKGNPLGF